MSFRWPIAPRPLLWLLLVASFYGGIQLGGKMKEQMIKILHQMLIMYNYNAISMVGKSVESGVTNIDEKALKNTKQEMKPAMGVY